MSFLAIRPYVKVGDTLQNNLVTDNGSVNKGTKITQDIYNQVQASSLIQLNVADTPEVTRNFTKNRIQTYNTDGKASFIYYNSGDAGYTFKVKVLVSKYDTLKDNKTVFYYLDYYYTNHLQVSVVIDTEIVPNGVYIISDFTDLEPIRKDYYYIEVEFSKYTEVKAKLTNKCTVLQSYLKLCKRTSSKVYTAKQIKKKKAKASTCIKYVNQMLYKKGFLSKKNYTKYGSYWTKSSRNALKKFQKKWNKQGLTPRINEKGSISKNCWKAIKRYPEVK